MTILNLNNISLCFSANEKAVLNEINYQINRGDFIILLGSNGSGKSTLLRLLHRHYQPTQGHIHLFDTPLKQFSPKIFKQHVAVLTQNCADSLFTALTVYENYLLMKSKKHPAQKKFLQDYLYDFNPNLTKKLDLMVAQLSGGEKQALALALCLLTPPTLLLLDEHTSALDPKTSEQIMQLTQQMLTQHQITCVLTTHDLNIATQYGNRILMLNNGRVEKTYDHQAKAVLSKEQLMRGYL